MSNQTPAPAIVISNAVRDQLFFHGKPTAVFVLYALISEQSRSDDGSFARSRSAEEAMKVFGGFASRWGLSLETFASGIEALERASLVDTYISESEVEWFVANIEQYLIAPVEG